MFQVFVKKRKNNFLEKKFKTGDLIMGSYANVWSNHSSCSCSSAVGEMGKGDLCIVLLIDNKECMLLLKNGLVGWVHSSKLNPLRHAHV